MRNIVKTIQYKNLTDNEIVDLIIGGNEEAAIYLIYDKYANDIRYKAWSIYETLNYLDDLNQILYMHLRGSNGNWQALRTFRNESKFKTWFIGSVVNNLFLDKRKEMIGSAKFHGIIVETDPDKPMPEPKPEHGKEKMAMVVEAIGRLQNEEYRLILIKDLEGYNHEEIAKMIEEKRKKENKLRTYRGKVVTPNAEYVDMIKGRAIKELRPIVEQIKNEWYGNK